MKAKDKQCNRTVFVIEGKEKPKITTLEHMVYMRQLAQQKFYSDCVAEVNKITDLIYPDPWKTYTATITIKLHEK